MDTVQLNVRLGSAARKRRRRPRKGKGQPVAQPYASQLHRQVKSQPDDPHHLAKVVMDKRFTSQGEPILAFWQGLILEWKQGRYLEVRKDTLENHVNAITLAEFDRVAQREGKPRRKVSQAVIANTIKALESTRMVEAEAMPIWLGPEGRADYFAFQNGLVSFEGAMSGQPNLIGATPKWFSTTCFPFSFDVKAECPKWEAFLSEVLPDDDSRLLLQQVFGYLLKADTSLQKFFIFEGKGGNGKGVVTSLLTSLLGADNVSSVALEQFGERFALAPTIGKLVNIVHELDKPGALAEGTLKSFVAGDRITIDLKHRLPVTTKATARLLITTNEWPEFRDRSDGITRRLIPLRFPVQIAPEKMNPALSRELEAELPGILNWALDGLRSLKHAGAFAVPQASAALLEELKPAADSAERFLAEHCEASPGVTLITDDLYQHYLSVGEPAAKVSKTRLGEAIRRVFPNAKPVREPSGPRRYGYSGVKLRDPSRPSGQNPSLSPHSQLSELENKLQVA